MNLYKFKNWNYILFITTASNMNCLCDVATCLPQVGYDTINSSEDQILKQDMPPALKRVEESSLYLLDASELLRSDPYSGPARKKLIEGSRGKFSYENII